MIIEKNKQYKIDYVKANGEATQREIIPLNESPKNIKALDITGLDESQKQFVLDTQTDYQAYVTQFLTTMFDFETWFEHTAATPFPENLRKYRTFTVDKIK